jgi:hypothetical protein
MADIYSEAYVTIAATKAANPSEGCYTQTEKIFLAERLPSYETIFVRGEPPDVRGLDWMGGTETSYFTREWIYQELVLYPRVLHFCPQEVVWHCQCMTRSESKRHELSGPYRDLSKDTHHNWQISRLLCHKIVMEYSQLHLTYREYQLPAVSAIARRMQDQCGDEDDYLAGLWKKTLLHDLLWTVHCYPPDTVRAMNSHVPTWSWAAIETRVAWLSADVRPECVQVVNIHYVTNGPRFTGGIEEATITLRAPLLEMKELPRGCEVHPRDYIDEHLISPADIHPSNSQSTYLEAVRKGLTVGCHSDSGTARIKGQTSGCFILLVASWHMIASKRKVN